MSDTHAQRSFRIDDHQGTESEAGGDREARRLSDLADLEVDMQNAVLCIRLRGDEDAMAEEFTLRRAA